jgi:hypothetical protein
MKSMKTMNATSSTNPPSTWLKTDRPVIPVNPATWNYLPEVETALHRGVPATPDSHHPGFFEFEFGEHWYYVHIPKSLRAVYIVAAQDRSGRDSAGLLAHQTAC